MATVRLFDLSLRYDRSDLTIVGGKDLQAEIGDAVTSIPVERSMEQANTLTLAVFDETQTLLRNSELFGRKRLRAGVLLEVDGFRFRLSELHKRRFGFDAVFYDEPSADLKRKHGALKTSRNAMTRPEVVRWMCVHAGVRSYVPEINTTPVVADLSKEDAAALAAGQRAQQDDKLTRPARAKGALKASKLTIKGNRANPSQLRAAERVQAALDAEGEPTHTRARLATTLAPIGESDYNIGAAEQIYGTHKGLYQSNTIPAADVEKQVHHFLNGGNSFLAGGARRYAKDNPGASVGEIVSKVEISDGDAQFYDNYAPEARAILDAWAPGDDEGDGDGLRTGSADRAYVEQYEFRIEADEDYLEAGARLAEEVRWRFFSDGQQVIYASDLKLAEAAAAVTLIEGQDGCDEISYTWTAKGTIDELQASAHLVRWQAPPGSVVVVDGEGPGDGRYLLRSISRDLLDPAQRADLVLGRPQAPLPEPASTVTTTEGTAGDIDDDASPSSDGRKVDKAYSAAARISDQKLPYIWGGGHARLGTPDDGAAGTGQDSGPGKGYDCSGYVCSVLAAAGLGFKTGQPGTNSGGLAASWGDPGEGKYMTVWANAGHTFIEFKLKGKSGRWADTSREAAPPSDSGPRLRTGSRSTAGFTPRHWPGT